MTALLCMEVKIGETELECLLSGSYGEVSACGKELQLQSSMKLRSTGKMNHNHSSHDYLCFSDMDA
jgi:hypothetical protein